MAVLNGIYLVSPHGRWLIDGYKTHVVKKRYFRNMVGLPLVLVEGNEALGVIKLLEPVEIDYEEFVRSFDVHRVTVEEVERWWGDFDVLYLYPVRILVRFPEPVRVYVPRGVQTFIREVEVPDRLLPERLRKLGYSVKSPVLIKEVMDYGEFERYFERLKVLLDKLYVLLR
jgi:hypothetical protein